MDKSNTGKPVGNGGNHAVPSLCTCWRYTHAHGVTIPDFPGCYSAADSWDELPAKIQEAIEVYCEGEDMDIPVPTSLEVLTAQPEYRDGVWLLVDVDASQLTTRPVRLNVSLPEGLVRRMDVP